MRTWVAVPAAMVLVLAGAWGCGGPAPPAARTGQAAAIRDQRAGVRVVALDPPRPRSAEAAAATKARGDAAFPIDGLLLRGTTAGLVIGRIDPATADWFEHATVYLPGAAVDVAAGRGVAWVSLGPTGVAVIDISNPQEPKPLALIETAGSAARLHLEGERMVVAAGHAGVLLFDVSDPARPVLLGAWESVGYVRQAVIDGDRVVVAEGTAGISLLAVEREGSLKHVWRVATAGEARAVALGPGKGDDLAILVADGPRGLALLSATGGEPAVEVGRVSFGDMARDVALAEGGRHAFVAGGDKGVFSVDIGDFAKPLVSGSLETAMPVNRLRPHGNLLLAGNDSAGLLVLDATHPAVLTPLETSP